MNANCNISRTWSFIIVTLVYIVAGILGWLSYRYLADMQMHYLWALFIADVVATVFVWIWGLIYKNVSVYDPYWSVLPPVMLTMIVLNNNSINMLQCLLLIAVWWWGIRLTGNWAYTFKGLAYEDWRYTHYRTHQNGFVFQIINFFGLNFMPTLVVFLAMIPGIELLDMEARINVFTIIGFIMSAGAATIQLIADNQKHRFAKHHKGEICKVGLWKHGRHPNYFGEVMMWWGVWVMYESVNCFVTNNWYIIGAIAMTCLFRFISVPLMERRQLQNKPGYADYRKETRMFI